MAPVEWFGIAAQQPKGGNHDQTTAQQDDDLAPTGHDQTVPQASEAIHFYNSIKRNSESVDIALEKLILLISSGSHSRHRSPGIEIAPENVSAIIHALIS